MKSRPLVSLLLVPALLFGCAGKTSRFDPITASRSGYPVQAPVRVVRDAQGVPHILADNSSDLFFGLGYAMAQDRFTEMDIFRRVARGELAEILGVPIKISGISVVGADRIFRSFHFREQAEAGFAAMAPADRALLEAFTAGVNRYLTDAGNTLTLYHALRLQPAPWRPEDSLATAAFMGFTQTMGSIMSEYYLERMRRALPAEDWQLFFPFYPEDGPIITTDHPLQTAFTPLGTRVGVGMGSNNWVLAGSKTESGKPLLANDPHVPTVLVPTFWYHVHLQGGGYDVAGMMFTGFPVFGAADNGKLAWALTNVMADHVDVFREKINPDNPNLYLADGQWVPFETESGQINRLFGKPVPYTFRKTRHGVVMDRSVTGWNVSSAPDEVLVFKHIESDLARFFHGYQQMALAESAEQFRAAAADMAEGPMAWNHVFADRQGTVGYQTTGRIPIRADRQGVKAREGWDSKNDWQGYVPFAELPRLINPKKGFVVTANNQVAPADYPYYLTSDYVAPNRSARITELIEAQPKLGLADMKAIQYDVAVLEARRWAPLILADLEGTDEPRLQRAAALLRDWQAGGYRAETDSAASCVYAVFKEYYAAEVFADEFPEPLAASLSQAGMYSYALEHILNDPAGRWWDDRRTPATETRPDITRRTMEKTMAYLEKKLGRRSEAWRWGDLHTITLSTTFGLINLPGVTYTIGRFGLPGMGETVRASGSMFDEKTGFADMVAGPSTHFLVDFSRPREIVWNATTGNSESPTGGRLGNTTQAWLNGDYFTLYLDEAEFRKNALGEMTLQP